MTDATSTDDELRKAAKRRLKRKAEIRNFSLSWLTVAVICVVVWAVTSPGGYFWPIWPIAGMGIAFVFMLIGFARDKGPITEAQIDAEMKRMQSK